jgi:hypothetical protein
MRAFRLLVASFLLLWLPLQAIAVVTMPFCAHSGHSHQSAHPRNYLSAAEEHDHHDADRPSSSQHGHQHGESGTSLLINCDDCGACHLACSPTAPAGAMVIGVTSLVQGYVELSPTQPPLFVPEPRKRPPVTAIA